MKDLKEFLDQVTAIQAVHDEESLNENFNALYEIVTPKDSPREMGETFKQAIGYDPITYYDERTIKGMLDKLITDCADYPQSVKRLQAMEGTILKISMRDGSKAKRTKFASSVWDSVKSQLEDVGEMNMSQIYKLGEKFMEPYEKNRHKEERKPRQDRQDDFDRMCSGMEDIDIESSIIGDDDDYDY